MSTWPQGEAPEDAALPTLRTALNRARAQRELAAAVADRFATFEVDDVRLAAYRPGRSALIEYDVRLAPPGEAPEPATLVGSLRRGRSGSAAYARAREFWAAGFAEDAPDAISIPEPIAHVPALALWVRRKVPGASLVDVLSPAECAALMERIAEAALKVHRSGVPAAERHQLVDELATLHFLLAKVADRVWLEARIERLLEACDRLAGTIPEVEPSGIHGHFDPRHIVVDGSRVRLLELDAYRLGDPALDAGTCIGHMIEQSLREHGDPSALGESVAAFESAYLERHGDTAPHAAQAYATLTLVRQVSASAEDPGRRHLTEPLLELCEERLALPPGHPTF